LRDEFGGFEAVGGEFYAIAVLFEHAADKFADADGVVGDNDDAFVLDAVDGFRGNGAAGDGGGAGCKNAGGAGGGLQGASLGGLGGDHAVEIDEQDQTAVGSDGGAGEKFYAAEIFAEIFDDDFIFAEDFFDDEADLAIAGVGDDHPEIAVDGFERGKAEISVETHDFGDDIANFGEQFSADVFDFIGAEAANFFDDGEGESEAGAAATDEESGRND